MAKTSQLFIIFIPAIILVGIAFFIRAVQFKPLIPAKEPLVTPEQTAFQVPILPGDPILGQKNSPKTIIAFEDYGCESCSFQYDILHQLLEKHNGQVKIVWKGLPATTYPNDTRATHELAFCMNESGQFDAFSAFAFANSQNLSLLTLSTIGDELDINQSVLSQCETSGRATEHVNKTEQIARALNIQSVPTFFVNNKQIQTPASVNDWEILLGLPQ